MNSWLWVGLGAILIWKLSGGLTAPPAGLQTSALPDLATLPRTTGAVNLHPEQGGPALATGGPLQLASPLTARSGSTVALAGSAETVAFLQTAVETFSSWQGNAAGWPQPGDAGVAYLAGSGLRVSAGFPAGTYTVYVGAQDRTGLQRGGQIQLVVLP